MKKRIAVIAGGDSGEYEVSVSSAKVVVQHLDRELYEPYLIFIKGQDWNFHHGTGPKVPVNRHDFTIDHGGSRISFDCVFIVIHGTPGENGKLQGYFDLLNLPYTTCDQTTSALTFNKYFALLTVKSLGVKTARSLLLKRKSTYTAGQILDEMSIPCFVKPNGGGSSVATTKVNNPDQLVPAIDLAFTEDEEVLVEEFIPGREITCGVITYEGEPKALPITEIISKKEFFDFEAKYEGASEEITPADIPLEIAEECSGISLKLYDTLNCRGIVRFDFIYNEKGMYFLEVNTVPGLSEASIVPQQAEHFGISLEELFTATIQAALEN